MIYSCQTYDLYAGCNGVCSLRRVLKIPKQNFSEKKMLKVGGLQKELNELKKVTQTMEQELLHRITNIAAVVAAGYFFFFFFF